MTNKIPAHVRRNLAGFRDLREKRHFTLRDLQVLTGIRQETIQAYENGAGTPTKNEYNMLAVVLGWRDWD